MPPTLLVPQLPALPLLHVPLLHGPLPTMAAAWPPVHQPPPRALRGGARPLAPMLPGEDAPMLRYASSGLMREDATYDKLGPQPTGWDAVIQESLGTPVG